MDGVQAAGDVVVRMPVTVEVSCASPDCVWINLPAVLRAYRTVKDTFRGRKLNHRRTLLNHYDYEDDLWDWLEELFDNDADVVIDNLLGFYGEWCYNSSSGTSLHDCRNNRDRYPKP